MNAEPVPMVLSLHPRHTRS